jgi:hypothetical protein
MRMDIGYVRRWTLAALASVGLAAIGLAALPAAGQGEERVASGDVVELDDGRAVLNTNSGPVTVLMDENTHYEREGPGTLADIQPGQFVGITGRPASDTLTAVIVRVFSVTQSTIPQGQSPMSGPDAGNLMTNAVVDSFVDDVLTVKFGDRPASINTAPDTQVLRPEPATAAEVQVGGRISAIGPMNADGMLQARVVYVRPPR